MSGMVSMTCEGWGCRIGNLRGVMGLDKGAVCWVGGTDTVKLREMYGVEVEVWYLVFTEK